jgi:hypothetical protein
MTTKRLVLSDWELLATREAWGAVDSWDEYLGLKGVPGQYTFSVLRHLWLGEVPEDWFDEEGELLPEHIDEDGELRLPEEADGLPVRAHMYGGFVGDLDTAWHDPVTVTELTEASVKEVLRQVGWDQSEFAAIWEGIKAALGLADTGRVSLH